MFALRCLKKVMPFFILAVMLGTIVGVFGTLIRIYERQVEDSPLEYIWNGGWIILVTLTTSNL
jgi:hypothetical protein